MIRVWPRPLRLSPLGMVTRTRIVRKSAKPDPESGSKGQDKKGVRVLDKAGERRQRMLADWLRTRRVDSPQKRKNGGADAGGAKGGAAGLKAEFGAVETMTRRVYHDLKKPMASG